jgi:hypothetical protein
VRHWDGSVIEFDRCFGAEAVPIAAKGTTYFATNGVELMTSNAERVGAVLRFRSGMMVMAGALTLCAPGSATRSYAISAWLTDMELQRFSNATVDGRYANGKSFTEHYGSNGRLNYVEQAMTLGGHWSITQGTLCTIYDFDVSGGCYRVMRVDTNCYEFYFTSRTEQTAPGPADGKPRWTARGAIQGQPSACKDEPSV